MANLQMVVQEHALWLLTALGIGAGAILIVVDHAALRLSAMAVLAIVGYAAFDSYIGSAIGGPKQQLAAPAAEESAPAPVSVVPSAVVTARWGQVSSRSNVRYRACPASRCVVVALAPPGARVVIFEQTADWTLVESSGSAYCASTSACTWQTTPAVKGWVASRLITTDD